jgi:small subunit ribosomal protein S20
LANHKSALKRVRQNTKRQLRNKSVKTRVKSIIKEVRSAANENAADIAGSKLIKAQSEIDKAAKKGVLHKRTAARKISRLAKQLNTLEA